VEVAVKPIIKVTMESDSQNLDEVVVVGYGTQLSPVAIGMPSTMNNG